MPKTTAPKQYAPLRPVPRPDKPVYLEGPMPHLRGRTRNRWLAPALILGCALGLIVCELLLK